MPFGGITRVGPRREPRITCECILASPGEYDGLLCAAAAMHPIATIAIQQLVKASNGPQNAFNIPGETYHFLRRSDTLRGSNLADTPLIIKKVKFQQSRSVYDATAIYIYHAGFSFTEFCTVGCFLLTLGRLSIRRCSSSLNRAGTRVGLLQWPVVLKVMRRER